ncbi:MAG: glycosyltransferase [Candidatus Marsarchaeota archaeon]|nr:glycosyltransferase [Candidatus Marsarchaeota archaeon]
MKLNIAFYTDTYEPAVDGVVTSINGFRKQLERRGHKVYIFASTRFGRRTSRDERVFLYPGVGFRPYPQYSVALFPYYSIMKLNSVGTDIIHSHTPFTMGLSGLINAKLSRLPIVGSFHTLVDNKAVVNDYYPNNKQLKKLTTRGMQTYVSFFYKRCNATVAPSETVARMLVKRGIEGVSVVPNMVDRKTFNRKVSGAAFRERLGIRDSERVVLYVGRLSYEKKLEVMLRSARMLRGKGIRFVIGGTGPAEARYRAMARRLGLNNTIFTGFVAQEDLPAAYASCDAFCMPSTFETQGIVALEAMASGKPVIGADYLALKDLIKNGINGEKFRAGDYAQCSRKIEKVLNNAGAYKHGAVETAEMFSPEKVTDKLIDVYRSVL